MRNQQGFLSTRYGLIHLAVRPHLRRHELPAAAFDPETIPLPYA